MNISRAQIKMVTGELSRGIEGAFANKVIQLGEFDLALQLRKGPDNLFLLISLSPRHARLHLLKEPPKNRIDSLSFANILKKTITRTCLSSIRQINEDRVVRLDFGGKEIKWSLIAEFTGTTGNLYLIDSEEKVIAIVLSRKSRNQTAKPYIPLKPNFEEGDSHAPIANNDSAGTDKFHFNFELEAEYEKIAMDERLARAKMAALAPLKADLKKTLKRIKELLKKKGELEKYSGHKNLGDILQANFHKIKKGERVALVIDPASEDQNEMEIAIDPALKPPDNVNRYYKLFRKFQKGGPRIEADLESLYIKERELKEKIEKINLADTLDEAQEFIPPPSKPKKQSRKSKQVKGEGGPRRFVTSDGFLALVGRSDRENDEITFKIANGRDLWLHARDYPGSHTLVKLPKGLKELSQNSLKEGAMLALKYSKAARAGKGEVTYCYAKSVRRIKGAPPGKVMVTQDKSIHVRIDDAIIDAMKKRAARL